ncbi:MAG: hypothetical protein ACE5FA_13970 [Dehalococcoidia bacterium]
MLRHREVDTANHDPELVYLVTDIGEIRLTALNFVASLPDLDEL